MINSLIGYFFNQRDYFALSHKFPPRHIRKMDYDRIDDVGIRVGDDCMSDVCCQDFELFNSSILSPSNEKYYRRGVVIIANELPLGHVKLKGERTFLAWRNIKYDKGYSILFGGIYSISHDLYFEVESTQVVKGNWRYLDVDKLALKPNRFIREDVGWNHINGRSLTELILDERERVEREL